MDTTTPNARCLPVPPTEIVTCHDDLPILRLAVSLPGQAASWVVPGKGRHHMARVEFVGHVDRRWLEMHTVESYQTDEGRTVARSTVVVVHRPVVAALHDFTCRLLGEPQGVGARVLCVVPCGSRSMYALAPGGMDAKAAADMIAATIVAAHDDIGDNVAEFVQAQLEQAGFDFPLTAHLDVDVLDPAAGRN